MSIKLKQPIINGSLRATNFFNGRLVTGADLTREQTSRREAVWRVGRAAGEGIVYGLEVEKDKDAGADPIVSVTKGLAVNRCGQALYLSDDTSVDLLQRFSTVDQPSKIFSDCVSNPVGTYAAGFGFYLLVLSPAESSEGSAQTSGLNNVFAACNTDVILETAQFNLIPVDTYLKNEILPNDKLLRNYLAYRCFGAAKAADLFKNPLGLPLDSYGLIDEMRDKSLADSDVPLAIIRWTSKGVEFVETWAVRRRVTLRDADKNWTQLVKDRRRSETEAMMMQFSDQIKNLEAVEAANLANIEAGQYFRYLPPAGLLPVASGSQTGFNSAKFFFGKGTSIATIDGDLLPVLLELALAHEPIDLNSGKSVQLYHVKENIGAAGSQNIRKTLVFARHSLPYMGQYVPVQQTYTFAPILLPLPGENIFRWFINFNQATVPLFLDDSDKPINGSMLVQLPDKALIKGIIIRGVKSEMNPKIFKVTLESQKFAGTQGNTIIATADLSKVKTEKIAEKVAAQKQVFVENETFQYVVSAQWQGGENRSLGPVELHSIQIVCEI